MLKICGTGCIYAISATKPRYPNRIRCMIKDGIIARPNECLYKNLLEDDIIPRIMEDLTPQQQERVRMLFHTNYLFQKLEEGRQKTLAQVE